MTKNIASLVITVFFSIIIFFLIFKQFVYPTLIPMVISGGASLFADWTVILNANNCLEKGYDVYLNNPCDHWNRKHVYGEILLKIPFIKTFPKFYYLYFPILASLIFLYVLVYSIFNLKNKKEWILLSFFILSVPVLLVIERNNIDLLIFIFMFFISKYNHLFLNHLLIIFSSISKIYPIVLFTIFFFENNFKKIIKNLLFLLGMFLIISLFQIESLLKIFDNKEQFTGYGYGLYEFSILGLVKFLKVLDVNFNGDNYNWLKYVYVVIFVILPLFLFNYFYSSKINTIFQDFNFKEKYIFENNFYLLSSTVILLNYIIFSNFVYREIFFLGLLPAILLHKSKSNKIMNFYFYLLTFKFFITTFLIYFYQNNILEEFKPFMIILKHTFDLYLMFFIFKIQLNLFKKFIHQNFLAVEN